jgi:ferredoxin-NADP reductase
MTSMTFTGALLEKITRTADSASFRFSRPPEYRFEAGQSYGITIASPEGPLQHRFSHADSPTEGFTELTTRLTGSPFKNALDALSVGDAATFNGPAGHFTFRYDEPNVAFLTGGIGITPVRGILRYLVDTDGEGRIPGQEIVLFYGCMTEDGIIYKHELDAFAAALPGLRVVYVITEPAPGWAGHSGFITPEVVTAELGSEGDWLYYVVGPPPMIAAMDKVAARLEIGEARMIKENFAGYTS